MQRTKKVGENLVNKFGGKSRCRIDLENNHLSETKLQTVGSLFSSIYYRLDSVLQATSLIVHNLWLSDSTFLQQKIEMKRYSFHPIGRMDNFLNVFFFDKASSKHVLTVYF